jgi:hypothetical protein
VTKRATALAVYCAVLAGGVIGAAVYDARRAVVVLAGGIAFVRRRRGLARRYRYATQGAAGELATAKMLALLPAGFTVVNDLAFQRFNVDHVVVGESGVWVVEDESHQGGVEERPDGIWLNGRRTYHDPAAAGSCLCGRRRGATPARDGERCWVEAIVCFPNATVTSNGHPAEACVVSTSQLLARLRLAPRRLGPDEREPHRRGAQPGEGSRDGHRSLVLPLRSVAERPKRPPAGRASKRQER